MAEVEETGDNPDIASIVVDSEIKEMQEFIGHSVSDYMLPPAGTGSRRGGLLYTLRALFHVITGCRHGIQLISNSCRRALFLRALLGAQSLQPMTQRKMLRS